MSSYHKAPYCWKKINLSQDQIKNFPGMFTCPGCKREIDNMDVTDAIQLVDVISLIKASGVHDTSLFEGIK